MTLTVCNLVTRPARAPILEPRIVGTWEWVSTQIEGQPTITPATAGHDLHQGDDTTLVPVDTGSPPFDTWTFQRRGPVPTSTRTPGELKQIYAD